MRMICFVAVYFVWYFLKKNIEFDCPYTTSSTFGINIALQIGQLVDPLINILPIENNKFFQMPYNNSVYFRTVQSTIFIIAHVFMCFNFFVVFIFNLFSIQLSTSSTKCVCECVYIVHTHIAHSIESNRHI